MGWVRLLAVPFALLEVGMLKAEDYPAGYHNWAWAITAALTAGAIVLLVLAYRASRKAWRALGLAALVFDSAIVYAYVFVYSFEPGTPIRQLVFIPLVALTRYVSLGSVISVACAVVALGAAVAVGLAPMAVLPEHPETRRARLPVCPGAPGSTSSRSSQNPATDP
jgi:hypothetical protein